MRFAPRSFPAAVVCLVCAFFSRAEAQVKVDGAWSGYSFAGGGTYANSFTLVQVGTRVFGSAIANGQPGTIVGTISGDQITFHSDYKSQNYSSDAVATTDGETMNGTFLDSQGTTGTFTAQNSHPALTRNYPLVDPAICRSSKDLKVYAQRFFGVENVEGKATLQYTVTVSGKKKRKVVSKSSKSTISGLAPGTYRVSYKVSAVRNGKVLFSSTTSPAASCVVR